MDAFLATFQGATANRSRRDYPSRRDARYQDGILFPAHKPKFGLAFAPGQDVFTIGSCFARNIEEALEPLGVGLPTRAFSVPRTEWPARPNGLLNEYNPGSIAQRITAVMASRDLPEATIVPSGPLFADLLLHGGSDVTWDRAIQRRQEIAEVYRHLPAVGIVIITLGFIEAWYDRLTECYLNRMPPYAMALAWPDRFVFHRMDVFDALPPLERAMHLLGEAGKKVILTVSPVPIQTTFDTADCVVANEFSKSVLRVCADRLARNFPHVDYFPSYEIVRSAGLAACIEDNVHVRDEVVQRITAAMIDAYRNAA